MRGATSQGAMPEDQILPSGLAERPAFCSLAFVPMRSLLLTGALAFTGGALGFCASSYGERIAFSSSAKAAAPFAAPFVLLAGGSAAALSLAMAAATERL
jgi:hypothetical protein